MRKKKTFAESLFSDLELRFSSETLINYVGGFTNSLVVKKSAQNLKIFTKIVSSDQIVGRWFSYAQKLPESSDAKQKLLSCKQKKNGNTLGFLFEQGAFECQRHAIADEKSLFFSHANKQAILPLVASQTICNYVVSQLVVSLKLKDKSFKGSLQKGFAKIASQLSKRTNFRLIAGIKIVCCGR